MKAKRAVVGLAAVLVVGWGCGGTGTPSVSSSKDEVTVKGNVTFKGAPFDGEITFDPSNINRKDATARTAKVVKGTYEVKTLVGDNAVTVHSPAIDSDPVRSSNRKIVDVKTGENTVPIDIP